MNEETDDGRDLTREITVRGTRYIWELHASRAHIIDLMLLQDDSKTLAAAAALVLAYPRFARSARFRRNLAQAAERLYALLEEQGWEPAELLRVGMHAFAWLADQLPPTSGSDEVEEAVGFSGAGPDDGPGES